jgi:hypothetical protein
MKRIMIGALGLVLAACGTAAAPTAPGDSGDASAGLLFGIEVCHRHVIDGVPIEKSVAESARGRAHARDMTWTPEVGILPPIWKLDGPVLVGVNDRGGCDIFIKTGNGPELRNLAVSTHLGMSSRRWVPMKIIAAPRGEVRDAWCTKDRVGEGKSVGVVMTSRIDAAPSERRTFVATVMQASAADCREQPAF